MSRSAPGITVYVSRRVRTQFPSMLLTISAVLSISIRVPRR